jgi:hypothetical protein
MSDAARSARPTPVAQVQSGTRSTRRCVPVVLAAFTLALALTGCGSGGGSSTGTSSSTTTPSTASTGSATPTAPIASAASVKACLEALGFTDEGAMPKAYLLPTDPNRSKNLYAEEPLQYHYQGTGFEAHGLPGQGDVYVDVATSPEEAALHAHESRTHYAEPNAQELIEKKKGEFHETHYKIGTVGNVAYLAWSIPAVTVASVKKCAKP